jgi:hypothetical protein
MAQKNDEVDEKEEILARERNTVPFLPIFLEPQDLLYKKD